MAEKNLIGHFPYPLKYFFRWSNIPTGILIIGAALRIFRYASSAIRYDEALSLYRATIPFPQYLNDLQTYSSLFMWELILRVISILGTNLCIIRLPSLAAGIMSLYLVWKLMEQNDFSIAQKSFVSVIISFTPGLIWISQDARAYGFLILFYLLAIHFVLEKKWLGLLAVNGLLMYTHIIGPAFAVSSLLLAIVYYPKEWKRVLLIGGATIISWLPWLFHYINLRPTEGFSNTFWLGKLTLQGFFWQFALAYFVTHINDIFYLISTITFVLSVIALVIYSIHSFNKIFLVFLTPFSIILCVSYFWENTLFYRTLITLFIPLAISLGPIVSVKTKNYYHFILIGFWIVMSGVGLSSWDPRLKGGDVDITAQYIRSNWQEGDVIYYATGTAAIPFDYYLHDKPGYLLNGLTNANLTPPTLVSNYKFIPLEKLSYKRAWIIYPIDSFLPQDQMKRMENYIVKGELINRVHIFEVPDILIYLVRN